MRPIDGIINVNYQFLDTQPIIIQTDQIKVVPSIKYVKLKIYKYTYVNVGTTFLCYRFGAN